LALAAATKFLGLYEAPIFPYTSLSNASMALELHEISAVTGQEYLQKNRISDLFAHDFVQAATRVNYAQNIDEIHGLEALVSIVASGAQSVVGGNWRIFHEMIVASGAKLLLHSSVTGIEQVKMSAGRVGWRVTMNGSSENFDGVVLASPYVPPSKTPNPKTPSPPSRV
jgi:prenylcysteine oxidase / farnesylcysteine lyase